MADTTPIKTQIEPYIRQWLAQLFPGHVFEERDVNVGSSQPYKADAVSEDGSIVAAILCSRPKTRTGRENTGGVRKARGDVSMLNRIPEDVTRLVVFTDPGFRDLVKRRAERWGVGQLRTEVCDLPDDLDSLLTSVLDDASHEQRAAQ